MPQEAQEVRLLGDVLALAARLLLVDRLVGQQRVVVHAEAARVVSTERDPHAQLVDVVARGVVGDPVA
eukprot:6178325-Pleurochrysis_carterae.AAC.8